MRFLVDASLSPIVSQLLIDNGHDSIHVGDILPLTRTSVNSSQDAARHGRPRCCSIARLGAAPREQAATLLANLPDVETDLRNGAIVVIEDQRLRVRSLPIGRLRDTEPH